MTVPSEYDLILADPPWRYSFSKSKSRRVENHYPTMTLKDICELSIPSAKDCILLLWATAPKLLEALKVMEAWGFTYKTQAVWDKVLIGMGYWFRGQHEILLLGTKGKVSPPQPVDRIGSVVRAHRGRHSEKPNEIIEWIERSFPKAKKLELFARSNRHGWYAWGNDPKIKSVEI